jgi:diadenosine tetraphosphate (Ap4A) HIT family hydrolase
MAVFDTVQFSYLKKSNPKVIPLTPCKRVRLFLIRRTEAMISIMASVLVCGCACHNTPATYATKIVAPIKVPAFPTIPPKDIIAYDELFVVFMDKYPISPGHTLIVARRPAARFQQLTQRERVRLLFWIDWTQKHLAATLNPHPDAFNFGLNDGPAAGQTLQQFHFHIIPRYTGDVPDPRGGVRNVILSKAKYWDTLKP